MKRFNFYVPVVLVVALVCALVSVIVVQAQQPEVLRLGMLTAADSPAGRGAQLAIAEINSQGGITAADGTLYAFELLSVPVTTADEVRAGLNALSERNVTAIIGPNDTSVTLATFNNLRELRLPVMVAAQGDSITIGDTSDFLFRVRAPEQVYTRAVVAYLDDQFNAPSIALVQADASGAATESINSFRSSLSAQGLIPRSTLQLNDPANLDSLLANLEGLDPDVVTLWGDSETAVALLKGLRDAGWDGVFFYRDAASTAFRDAVVTELGQEVGTVLGVTNWLPGVRGDISDAFLRSYVTTFDSVPDDLSAAYYDAVYLLAAAVQAEGGTSASIRSGLLDLAEYNGAQGLFSPKQYTVGETINAAVLFELNVYAVPQVQALFVDGALVANGGSTPRPAIATATPVPPTATPTITPTATPEGVYGVVDSARLNVRTGPSTSFDILGQLNAGDLIFPVGANQDFSWLVVSFRGTQGWVFAGLVDLGGNLNELPIIVPPPTPTVAPTMTPSLVPFADLVVVSATLEPTSPLSGQQFVVRTIVRNQGNVTSPETAVAASFQPGDVYTSGTIPSLLAGQATEVLLRPTVTGSGTYTVELVVDLNNLVNEGTAGEANNLFPVTYTLNHTILRSGSISMTPGQQHDPVGSGTMNLAWDGSQLTGLNGAQVAVLPGVDWNTLRYSQLAGVAGNTVPRASLPTGIVVGLVTAPEGYRGALRITGYDGDTLRYEYRIYAP
jgi:ABC-type branched-subunit amino acid transport system substrate-binding protein